MSNSPSFVKLVKLKASLLNDEATESRVPLLVMAAVELRLPSKPTSSVPEIVMAEGMVTLAKPGPPSPMATV